MYDPRDRNFAPLPSGSYGNQHHHHPQMGVHEYAGADDSIPMGILQHPRGGWSSGQQSDSNDRMWASRNQRAAAELIKDLPSHRLEEFANKVGTNQQMRDRKTRRSKYATLSHIPRDVDVENILTAIANEADGSEGDLEDDAHLTTVLRDTTAATLSDKKQLRRKMTSKRKARHVSWWKRQKYKTSLSWLHFKYKMAEVGYYLKLWKGHMKKIEGHFGTGVLSYFRFLQWLFLLNIPIFLLTLAFVIIPQVIFRYVQQDPPGYTNKVTLSGIDFLTGGGWFNETELYYGYYTDRNITLVEGHHYNMQFAYLFTCGGYYLLCLIILAYSMSKSYRENYIEGSDDFGLYMATKVFGGWDCGITSRDAANLKHKSLFKEFQEYLSGFASQEGASLAERFKWFFLRFISNIIVLGLIGGAGYLVYYLSTTQQLESDIWFLREMALPLTVSAMLLIMPFAYSVIGTLEQYTEPKTELYVTMVRTMLLKGVILGVLIYYWFNDLPYNSTLTEEEKGNNTSAVCWETWMGIQIYKLVLVDFLFFLIFTFLAEFVRRLLAQYCFKKLTYPEFNIGRNTLSLIYSQTLCWLGTFYSPMLSLITIIKLFIMFYVKRFSVMQNCQASVKPWRASRTHTIFLGFLFCFFLLATVAVTCSIIFNPPSQVCGPYRGKSNTYDVVVELIDDWEERHSTLSDIIDFITSPGFIASIIVVLCAGTYYMHIILAGHKEMVARLKHQLVLEGKDKTYLLDLLQMINQQNRQDGVSQVGASPRRSLIEPTQGKKHEFIKSKLANWEMSHSSDTFENRRGKGHRLF